MKAEPGFEFSFWGGDIWGKNIEVFPAKKLVQEWFGNDWPKPSIATFNLESKGDTTELTLIHEGVPVPEIDDFVVGWKDFYLGPMKKYLESK
ncbi:MAG: Activator of Hsp90 ATPase 1 family protein [Candidatus Berkelbacteria bacterium]|nr:Activator of Hsp90 ATPase 1 family protein [Candidatus Berkelbacteria bacterium]